MWLLQHEFSANSIKYVCLCLKVVSSTQFAADLKQTTFTIAVTMFIHWITEWILYSFKYEYSMGTKETVVFKSWMSSNVSETIWRPIYFCLDEKIVSMFWDLLRKQQKRPLSSMVTNDTKCTFCKYIETKCSNWELPSQELFDGQLLKDYKPHVYLLDKKNNLFCCCYKMLCLLCVCNVNVNVKG